MGAFAQRVAPNPGWLPQTSPPVCAKRGRGATNGEAYRTHFLPKGNKLSSLRAKRRPGVRLPLGGFMQS